MADTLQRGDSSGRIPALTVFVLFFAVFLLLSSGHLGLDTAIRREVTQSMLEGQGFTAGHRGRIPWTRNGKQVTYSVYGVGQSLLFIPFELTLVRPLRSIVGPRIDQETQAAIIALTFFPAFGAIAAVLLFLLALELAPTVQAAWRFILIAGFCSPLLVYGSDSQEVSQVLSIELFGLLLILRGTRSSRMLVSCGGVLCLWTVTVIRPNAGIDAALFSVWAALLWLRVPGMSPRQKRMAATAVGLTAVAAAILCAGWFLAYNFIRFGDPWSNPYSLFFAGRGIDPFSNPFWRGMLGPLASLDKSIFLYCPVLIPALGLLLLRRSSSCRGLDVCAWLVFMATVVCFARYVAWAGDFASGPRLETHLVPLLLLPLLPGLESPRMGRVWVAILACSLFVQLSQRCFDAGLEIHQNPRLSNISVEMSPRNSVGRWAARFVNIGRKLAGTLEHSFPGGKRELLGSHLDYLTQWDFFWSRGLGAGWLRRLIAVVMPLTALCAAFVCLVRLHRRFLSRTDPGQG